MWLTQRAGCCFLLPFSCRSIMKAQMLSLPFTPVFAALVSIVNTKLPMVGELLVVRLVSQFRRSFKRNDKVRVVLEMGALRHMR